MNVRILELALAGATAGAVLLGCGGGSGLGPGEKKQREDELKDILPTVWGEDYKSGDYQSAIESFRETLQQADATQELDPAVRNQVKSEAHNGIGWSYFKMQSLDSANVAFAQATRLDRRNADAWAGWSGVALAQKEYGDAAQYAAHVLETDSDYSSSGRTLDDTGRFIGHDDFSETHVRLLLAQSYFHLGRYRAADREDPNNAAAQLRIIRGGQFAFTEPGDLIVAISNEAEKLENPF